MKIALINDRYSPNLGDGVSAECLEKALLDRLPGVEIVNCDLAGRLAYDSHLGRLQRSARQLFLLLPAGLRRRVARLMLEAAARLTLMGLYRERLAGVDLAIFGGGRLLSDIDYNFPIKIAAVSAVARALHVKFVMYSLGVGEDWSSEAGALFREAFANAGLEWTSVCDRLSLDRWERHFIGADLPVPTVNIDPSVLAADVYPDAGPEADQGAVDVPAAGARKRIGLCIAAPMAGDAGGAAALYEEMARQLIDAGFDVCLFVNGAPEDEAFLKRFFNRTKLAELGEDRIAIAPRSSQPAALVEIVRGCDGVIARQLHVNMIAYSLGIPHVGLGGDGEVEGFFREVGREQFVLSAQETAATRAVERLVAALEAGIDEANRNVIVRRVNQDLDNLAVAIGEALGMDMCSVVRRAASATVAEIHPSASARRGPIAS